MASNPRVVLNVGGAKTEVAVATLQKFPNSKLAKLFPLGADPSTWPVDDNNEYFIDRNAVLFEIILDYYRTGELVVPANVNKDKLTIELDYFELKPPSVDGGAGENENSSDENPDDHGGEPEEDEEVSDEDEEANEPTNDASGASPAGNAAAVAPAPVRKPLIERYRAGVANLQEEDSAKWKLALYQLLDVWGEAAGKKLTGEDIAITDCRYNIALAYFKLHNVSDSRKYLNEILAKEPNHLLAKNLLAKVEDRGSTYAKIGFVAVATVALGFVAAWRYVSNRRAKAERH